ncbi:hypothetical protein K449DRAFT_117274 [Hypoxylon sp. EC38]|nr:hypothetical protein K449DRAFT_117274 [Hypoxylon sp. EC38]
MKEQQRSMLNWRRISSCSYLSACLCASSSFEPEPPWEHLEHCIYSPLFIPQNSGTCKPTYINSRSSCLKLRSHG